MNKTFKKVLGLALVVCMLFSVVATLASCGDKKPEDGPAAAKTYTYNDAVTVLSTNWNPHTYQTTDESYPMDFLSAGLYSFVFNDALNPVEGKDAYAGYKIVPEMAAELPVDVTEEIKATGKYNIPESATSGYAYKIALNPNATWQNGVAINADTYVYSMQQLLNPQLLNYRASDYFDGSLCIAGAENYYYQGQTIIKDGTNYAVSDYLKADDGQWLSPKGFPMFVAVDAVISYLSPNTLADYVNAYGDQYFSTTYWANLVAAADENGYAPLNDESYAWIVDVITGNPNWGEDESYIYNYLAEKIEYAPNYDFSNVGIFKSGEYEITLVFGKSLAGFNLLYNLSGNWIVYKDLYEAGMSKVEGSDNLYVTNYQTSLATTMSYGPYKMTGLVEKSSMTFERNENWYGYSDGKHVYVDPTDGKTYDMYQTDKIFTRVVPEASTRKLMFLSGELMGYGLQTEDYEQYRNSDYCYATPSETIFFFIFNGYLDAIQEREANFKDDEKGKYDLETLTLQSFRKAIAVTYDKEALCTAVSPARSGGYGLIGSAYIYDPETGARYRDTDQAKKALCEFYSVDVSKYASLDEAVASITGYDPVTAKELYAQAFNEALEAGYITDDDNDGKSDQIVQITYASSASSAFITKTLDYLNQKLTEVLVGTPFEGKIKIVESAPLGNEWSNHIKAGTADTVLGGWSGSALDPFGLSELYTNPAKQYDAKWFDASSVKVSLEVNTAKIGEPVKMETLEMNLKQWSDALNGATVKVNGVEYNFGDGIADVDTRLDILAMIETQVLMTYDYIPMLQDGSMALLTKQVYYVVEEYNPIMGRGGIRYMKYNYDDAAWAAYVQSCGGELSY